MPRIRSLKPEFWTDSKMVRLSAHARLLFQGVWSYADEWGVVEDDAVQLKLRILPADDVDPEALLNELIEARCVVRATTQEGDRVLVVPSFREHQKVDTRLNPRFGDPSEFTYPCGDTTHTNTDMSAHVGDVSEGVRGQGSGVRVKPLVPTGVDTGGGKSKKNTPRNEDAFTAFGSVYPRRDGKPWGKGRRLDAIRAWNRIPIDEHDAVVDGAKAFAKDVARNETPIPHASTWLNQRGWEDALGMNDPNPQERGASPVKARAERGCPWCDQQWNVHEEAVCAASREARGVA